MAAQRRGRARPRQRQGRIPRPTRPRRRPGRPSNAPIPPRSCAGAPARRTSPPAIASRRRVAPARDAAAAKLGAGWLRGEIEGLAARARLVLADADGGPPSRPAAAGPGRPVRAHAARAPGARPRGRGRTNREIGDSLFMAEKTASVHVSRILAKLDVRSRTEAAAVAHRLGLDGDVAATRPA